MRGGSCVACVLLPVDCDLCETVVRLMINSYSRCASDALSNGVWIVVRTK
jgi:hypothetical protein